MALRREFRPAVLAAAPLAGAVLVMAAGAMLIASGATPSSPERFMRLSLALPTLVIDVSHFASSVLGLVLVMLAFGLRSRLDAAWAASVAVLFVTALLSLSKGLIWEEGMILAAIGAFLAPLRAAFPRKAALSQMEVSPGWLLSAGAAVAGAGLLGLWFFSHVSYEDRPFWSTMVDGDVARSIRAWAGAALAFLGFGLWRLVATAATPKVIGEDDPDFERVRAVLAASESAEPISNLALFGDKRFLFSESGQSFLMFGVRGRSWIALGGPVGRRDERLELLWRFRELADAHAARPGLYGIGPDDLPDIVELGFSIQKIGECARLPIQDFAFEGQTRAKIRRAWRQVRDGGAEFEVIPPGGIDDILPELSAISDEWLARQSGGDKAFALGGFNPRYLREFPVAIARWEGRIVAFANLWPTACRDAFSIDLMRYNWAAPKRIMDFLFVELISWGREQGYGYLDFGNAPLAGLEDRPLAPVMTRVGRLMFDLGEDVYNFQGVRSYKDKFHPNWEPRYAAAPAKWAIAILLADVSLLSSGGLAGLTRRPKKAEIPPPRKAEPAPGPVAVGEPAQGMV
ncbi:MAG: bifunctional lysylphosphatidylglycerol flippase/synthetase MprF [Phenylobacterium sp.]|nr:bifunctional lysylphosphatidylglycerol flippase/synthetase MprF [Phenylobacterium sp.]MCE2819297.1 bifunctional lysylphosphatidylglycerol flippase/synthetase MprF [Phenylobacterium sp.]